MQSSIYVNNLTLIDYAFINNRGEVAGGSFRVAATFYGEVEEKEQVVVDFGAIKKATKALIDDKEVGFDHKLWLIPGYSKFSIVEPTEIDQPYIVQSDYVYFEFKDRNAFVVMDKEVKTNNPRKIEKEIVRMLLPRLQSRYPTLTNIEIVLTTDMTRPPIIPRALSSFRYTHGLRNSTSWGCQNTAHGHLSYITCESDSPEKSKLCSDTIAKDLNGVVFIDADNLTHGGKTDDTYAAMQYVSLDRGIFKAAYMKTATQKVRVLPSETTIENLADWVATTYSDILKENGIKRVFVSEGLDKGSSANVCSL